MAVSEQTPYKEYTANGSANSFALEFDCENQDHLIVLVDDVEPVVGTWSLSGGAVVFGTAPTTGKKITIQRNTPFRRDGDFQSYDNSFRPPGVNNGFDKIWLKLQELGVADWILSTRINDLRAYVERQDSVLQENIDNLKTYVDDRDDELRAYLLEEIRKQGVALDQLDEYYNYLMQRLAQIAVSRGWDASFITDAGGSTQQDINDFGGAKWRNKAGGYALGATVKLDNGDIVKSTTDGNTNNPNSDMTGWVNPEAEQKEINRTTNRAYNSVSELRSFKPSYDGEQVYLNGLNAESVSGSGYWYYDATDTTSSDNGWFIVKTNSNKVLKRVGWYNEIDLDWAAIPKRGDLAVRWQEAIDFADSIRIGQNSVFDSPRIIISGQTYTMSKGVVQPPYLSTVFRKSAFLNVSKLRSEMEFAIKLQSKDNTFYLYDSDKSPSWNYALTTEVGKVVVRFTGDTATTAANRPSGIVTGNAVGSVNTYSVNCRVANFEFRYFKDSHEILGKDSWCFRFENCQLDGSPVNGRYGVHTSTSTANINSGERCTYVNCFLGGLNLETPGMGLYFTDCSADFVDGAIVTVQTTAAYQDIRFTNCHFEVFECIVDSKVVSFAEDISIYITGGNWLTNGLHGKKQAQDRILFKGRQNTKVRDVFITAPIFASQNDGSKIVESGAGVNVSFSKMHFSSNRPRVDSSKIISRKNDFAADAVATLPSSISTTNFEDRNGNGNLQTTSYIKASPEKGTNCFSPQANASNSYLFIRSKEKTPVVAGRRYIVRPIVEIADSSRNGKFIPFIDWFDKDGVFISRSDATTFTLQEYITGANVAWADRLTKLIPIVTPSLLAPVGAALAQHGVNCTNLDVGMSDYYLHSVILYDSLEN